MATVSARSPTNHPKANLPAIPWTKDEVLIVKTNYKSCKKRQMLKLLPGRTWGAIVVKANRMGVLKHDGNSIYKHNNGYVLVRSKEYPEDWRGRWKDGRVYMHNVVWFLNHPDDPILDDEVIHHKNGIRDDNRIGNLEKMKESDHGALPYWIQGRRSSKPDDEPFYVRIDEEPTGTVLKGHIDAEELNALTWDLIRDIERES